MKVEFFLQVKTSLQVKSFLHVHCILRKSMVPEEGQGFLNKISWD